MIDLCTKGTNHLANRTNVNGTSSDKFNRRPAQASETESVTQPDESKVSDANESEVTCRPSLPSPKVFFPHFINYTDHFIHFLEEVISKHWSTPDQYSAASDADDRKAVWNTLLELYLTPLLSESVLEAKYHEKALDLLKDDCAPYDRSHALMICYIRSFVPGQILIWEKMGMHEDIIRFWIDQDRDNPSNDSSSSKEVLRHLEMYGSANPHLYKVVLRYLTSTPDLLRKHRDDVVKVLDFIERENVMAPIEVVQLLSRNNVASVDLVQQWLMKRIKKGKEEVATVRHVLCSVGICALLMKCTLRIVL